MTRCLLWRRPAKSFIGLILAFQLTGCACGLDKRIAELNQNISAEQAILKPLADPYRGKTGKDIQLDITGRPIEDTIQAFDDLGFNDKTMTMQSTGYSGYIAQAWTDCPWPFDGHIGFQVVPAFDQAFAAALHVDQIDHGWNQSDGLTFRFHGTLGLAGFIVGGKTELCGLEATIPVGLAAVVLGTNSATGNSSLDTSSGDGISYHLHFTQPIYMIAAVVTPVFSGDVPLAFKFELTKGKIPSVIGKDGSVTITPNGLERKYTLQITFDQANFLAQGLSGSGQVAIHWQESPH